MPFTDVLQILLVIWYQGGLAIVDISPSHESIQSVQVASV
jgi:hypothetical protein